MIGSGAEETRSGRHKRAHVREGLLAGSEEFRQKVRH